MKETPIILTHVTNDIEAGLLINLAWHRKAEKALREQEQFLRATINGLSAHICVIGAEGKIIKTNRAWNSFGTENNAGKNYIGTEKKIMGIQWQADLATGHNEIDGHHKEIFNKIRGLIVACKENREKPAVTDLLVFLSRYVDSHFVVEEGFMERNGNPNIIEHLRQHDSLREDLKTLITQCAQEGVTLGVVTNTLKLTYLWLRDHIQLMDKDMVSANGSNK